MDGEATGEVQRAKETTKTAGPPTRNAMTNTEASLRSDGNPTATLFAVALARTSRNTKGSVQLPALSDVHALPGNAHFNRNRTAGLGIAS